MQEMDDETIRKALGRLSDLLKDRGLFGEVCLLGGAVMVLAFKARPSTKDVDAIFKPSQVIREMAGLVKRELGLPENWLNDGAKGFVSTRHETTSQGLPQFEALRLTAPTAEYMLAMKCMASRVALEAGDKGDVADIKTLIGVLGLKTANEALEIVKRYYPEDRAPPRARFLLEEVFGAPEDER